jgi:hypothetical protein
MSRNYLHPRAESFCVQIQKNSGEDLRLQYELLNLVNNQVEGHGHLGKNEENINVTKIEFGHLQAGNYQLTLRNISHEILSVELCPGRVHFKICVSNELNLVFPSGKSFVKEMEQPFPTADHCFLRPASPFGNIFPHGYTNATLQSIFTLFLIVCLMA